MSNNRHVSEVTIEDYRLENQRLKRELALLRQIAMPGTLGQRFGAQREISPYVLERARVDVLPREREVLLYEAMKVVADRLVRHKTVFLMLHYEEERLYDPVSLDPRANDLLLRVTGRLYEPVSTTSNKG